MGVGVFRGRVALVLGLRGDGDGSHHKLLHGPILGALRCMNSVNLYSVSGFFFLYHSAGIKILK
jgi:hypothetical protein